MFNALCAVRNNGDLMHNWIVKNCKDITKLTVRVSEYVMIKPTPRVPETVRTRIAITVSASVRVYRNYILNRSVRICND